MRLSIVVIVGVITLSVIASHVAAGGPEYHHHEQGWFSSLGHKINSWMPWGSKLGSDHVDTLHKVEHIYEDTHREAQRRVDELKENMFKGDRTVQQQIAEIYLEEAERAEREIEALKHPMFESLMFWRSSHPDTDTSSHSYKDTVKGYASGAKDYASDAADSAKDYASDAAKGASKLASDLANKASNLMGKKSSASKFADRARDEVDDISKKITGSYREALKKAQEQAKDLASGAGDTWEDTKAKAADVYNTAFHKGHGKSRTFLGKFRDTLGHGISAPFRMAATVCHKTFDFFSHLFMAAVYMTLGGIATVWGLGLWRARRFQQQLNANVSGPIVAVGESMVLGNEQMQRKFFDFWSGPAASYFNKQSGLRKQWMHRGVASSFPSATNTWLSYSEWASSEDLRRALNSPEFCELKKRSPFAVQNMSLYQLGSVGKGEMGGSETAGDRGLRQRPAASTTTAN